MMNPQLIVRITGREALPVRAIPFVTGSNSHPTRWLPTLHDAATSLPI